MARPASPRKIALPARQRRYRFSMTAMADMLFQLLIFFMLSANLTPFAMLDLRMGGLAGPAEAQDGASAHSDTLSDIRATAVWTLSARGLTAGGQRFGLEGLEALADALALQGTANVLVVLRPDVAVQDVITVLEVLAARGIASVQIADGAV